MARPEKTENADIYERFFDRFGGSCRTKHLRHTRTDLRQRVWNLTAPLRGIQPSPDKRPYHLPRASALPKEYIRLDPWEMEYLFTIATLSKKAIVEIGRFNGGSAFMLSFANPSVPIHSVDIAPQDDERLKGFFRAHGVGKNVDLIVGDSQKGRYDSIKDVDLLWIDGDHSYEGCMSDLTNWYDKVVPGGHILFHDCYFGSPVQNVLIDFLKDHRDEVVVSPLIPGRHWLQPKGSLAHLIKR